MATGSRSTGRGGGVLPGLGGKQSANVILHPAQRVDTSEERSAGDSVEASVAELPDGERRYAEWMGGEHDPLVLNDGLGTLRGFVLVVGLYLVLGAIGLGGLILLHWLI